MEFIKIIFTVAVAAFGWWITHYYTSKRDTENQEDLLVLKLWVQRIRH